ncbi:diguanylate cyclase [Pseudoalteromonas sp. TB64]|uniref:tetratricopeptide repeat-containing diguanylate cyclase n=1 Tax=Pseudoalteromonas sp. TB64 TaxID=1938600 RepID=UPI00041AFFB3|nr:diguanylate cyclase [Pseudoalteromonas sp. TB64]
MIKLFISTLCVFICFNVFGNTVKKDIKNILSGRLNHFETHAIFVNLEKGLPYPSTLDNARVKAVECWLQVPRTESDFKQFNTFIINAKKVVSKSVSLRLNLDLQTCEALNLYVGDELGKATTILNSVIDEIQINGDMQFEHANALQVLGQIYRSKGRFQDAFLVFQQAYQLFDKGDNNYNKALLLRQIGLIHSDLYNFKLAIEQLQRAIFELTAYNEQEWYKATDDLAYVYEQMQEREKAILLYAEISERVHKYEDDEGVAYPLVKIAEINIQLGNLDRAKLFLDKASNLNIESDWAKFIYSITWAEWFVAKGMNTNAQAYYDQFSSEKPQSWSVDSYKRFLEFKRVLAVNLNNSKQEVDALNALLKLEKANSKKIANRTLLSQQLEFDWEQRGREIARLEQLTNINNKLLEASNSKAFWQIASLIFAITLAIILALIAYKQSVHKQRFKTLALKDELTGIANRRAIFTFKKRAINKSVSSGKACSLIAIDIDYFKQVNDTYGHDIGDELIISVVKSISKNIRETDCVGRVGGEEFLVVLADTQLDSALEVAHRIRENIDSCVHTPHKIKSTASMGVIEVIQGESPVDAFKRADIHLYTAKNTGRNRVVS